MLIRIPLLIYCLFFLIFNVSAKENERNDSISLKGYISNKHYLPLKLKVLDIDKDSFYLAERNLEDNSIEPYVDLMINAELSEDYSLKYDDVEIFIPKSTKFTGHISEIVPAKSFNRKGFYKVDFDSIVCPDKSIFTLKSNITSRSQIRTYNPAKHFGKTAAHFVGGSIIGALFSYEIGGIGLITATHGYSLAGAAAAGGLIGTVIGVTSKGKKAYVEPGDDLKIVPIGDVGVNELKQIACKPVTEVISNDLIPDNIALEIQSVKRKKDEFGEPLLKITISLDNKTKESINVNNFLLRDSQGKEYFPSFLNFKSDVFIKFPKGETVITTLDFPVEHPSAKHWLVLKDKSYNKKLGEWILPDKVK